MQNYDSVNLLGHNNGTCLNVSKILQEYTRLQSFSKWFVSSYFIISVIKYSVLHKIFTGHIYSKVLCGFKFINARCAINEIQSTA